MSAERERKRRAERLLGDLLPDTTSDESDEGWSEQADGDRRDEDIKRDVPPHHG